MSKKDFKLNIIGKRKIWYAVSILIILAGIVSFAQSSRFYMDMVDNSVFNGVECNIVETADGDWDVWNVTITNTSNLHYS